MEFDNIFHMRLSMKDFVTLGYNVLDIKKTYLPPVSWITIRK